MMISEANEFQKKSVSLHGHKTSISLERAFWTVLEIYATSQGLSLAQLIQKVDEDRQGNLASALRLFALSEVLMRPELFQSAFKHPACHGQSTKRD